MGVGGGNLRQLGSGIELVAGGGTYPEGTVLSGQAHRELDRVVRSVGLTWSIQDGNLMLKQSGQPLETTAYLLSTSSGLLETPSKDSDGLISAKALLIPDLYPGRKVVVESRDLDAQTFVKKVRYAGNTFSNEWYAELELEEY
jgi:hypothetical protein